MSKRMAVGQGSKLGQGRQWSKWLRALTVLAVAVAAGLFVAASEQRSVRNRRVNVLLVSLDTTRRDHLSCYGYKRSTTPQLDALAREGLLFTRCVATSNWTVPTHASMLTGLYPSSHGAHWVTDQVPHVVPDNPIGPLDGACETLAEVVSDSGYRTAAIVANGYLAREFGLDQGFQHYDFRPGEFPAPYRQAEEITDEAIRWLGANEEQPFFLFLNYLDPHPPYNPPPPFNTLFRPRASTNEPRTWGMRFWSDVRNAVLTNRESPSPEVAELLHNRYDAEIAYADDQVGRLLQWLRRHGMYEQTLIFVTGDHGESFGEHALLGHSLGLYEPEVAVPMIVKLPLSRRSRVIDENVGHADILPTALEVLGLPTPGTVQGRSMLGQAARDVVAEQYVCTQNARAWPRFNRMQRALYRGDLKLLEYSDGQRELYDLRADPQERNNLADVRPDETRALQTALRAWSRQTRPLAENGTPAATLPAEVQEQLRDLGYLQ